MAALAGAMTYAKGKNSSKKLYAFSIHFCDNLGHQAFIFIH